MVFLGFGSLLFDVFLCAFIDLPVVVCALMIWFCVYGMTFVRF